MSIPIRIVAIIPMFFKLNVSVIGYKGIYYYFIGKGFVVNIMDITTLYDQERSEKKVRWFGF